MQLKRITKSGSPEAQKLITLHSETFPQYERFQHTSLMANFIDNAHSMYFNAIYERDTLAGFFIYWDLGNAYYIHFIAVYPEMRNQKIGQQILAWVTTNLHLPVFLESEVPYDDITSRRFEFYKRNGFQEIAKDPETLASNRKGGHPQYLMATQTVENLETYLVKIKEHVYLATGE